MDAMILAAGRGERLRPLTDNLPKPLLEIEGISLIEIHLYNLRRSGYHHIIINLHHLGDMIQAKLGDGRQYGLQISYSIEPEEALETAGGITHALHLIKTQKFAVISADILCDYPLSHLQQNQHVTQMGQLIMVDNPAHHPNGDFVLPANAKLALKADQPKDRSCTYSGIAWFDRALFEDLPAGKMALRPILETAIRQQQLDGTHYAGIWNDIGTHKRLAAAKSAQSVLAYIESIKQSTN